MARADDDKKRDDGDDDAKAKRAPQGAGDSDADETGDEKDSGDAGDEGDGDDADDDGDDNADDEDGGDDDGDDEDAEDAAEGDDDKGKAAAPAARAKAKSPAPTRSAGESKAAAKPAARPQSAAVRRRPPATPAPVPARGASTRNMLLFVGLVVGIAAALAIVGNMSSPGGGGTAPRFEIGKTTPIALTLTVDDLRELGCAMADDVSDLHCAFESASKPSAKGQKPLEDATLLQPYTTVDGAGQILGAGLWAQPALKEKLEREKGAQQTPRFSVDCKFEVKGVAASGTQIRWHARDPWLDGNAWPVGALTDCKVGK